uniref:Uncharacterized protein n=1 Tax=Setaria digitata TaxID=48799 RepID=A0A915PKB9_9BILA
MKFGSQDLKSYPWVWGWVGYFNVNVLFRCRAATYGVTRTASCMTTALIEHYIATLTLEHFRVSVSSAFPDLTLFPEMDHGFRVHPEEDN